MRFLINRYIPFILSLFIFIGFEILFIKPEWIYFLVLYFIFLIVALTWKVIGRGLVSREARWNFLITPLFLIISGLFFVVFSESLFLKHFLAVLLAISIGLFLENIVVYIYFHEKYQINSLENISNYINLISAFFFYSSFFGIFVLLNAAPWLLALLVLAVTILLVHQTMWINKIFSKKKWFYILITGLILVEIFWAVTFLPTSFYVNGVILSIAYYAILGISRNYLLKRPESKKVLKHLIISLVMLILILGTARWI